MFIQLLSAAHHQLRSAIKKPFLSAADFGLYLDQLSRSSYAFKFGNEYHFYNFQSFKKSGTFNKRSSFFYFYGSAFDHGDHQWLGSLKNVVGIPLGNSLFITGKEHTFYDPQNLNHEFIEQECHPKDALVFEVKDKRLSSRIFTPFDQKLFTSGTITGAVDNIIKSIDSKPAAGFIPPYSESCRITRPSLNRDSDRLVAIADIRAVNQGKGLVLVHSKIQIKEGDVLEVFGHANQSGPFARELTVCSDSAELTLCLARADDEDHQVSEDEKIKIPLARVRSPLYVDGAVVSARNSLVGLSVDASP